MIDFNIAKRFKDPENGNPLRLMTNTGTPKYKAPEILLGWNSDYNEKVDLWSAGAVLYYIVCGGVHAFNFENVPDIEKAIEKGDFAKTIP